MIIRTEYLDLLKRFKDKDLIKVITGIRRCGKSTLFDLFIEYLKDNNVHEKQIIKEITGCDDSSALSFYNKSGRRVPEAVLMLQFDLGKEEAAIILSEAGGNLHNAISICEANNYKKNSV